MPRDGSEVYAPPPGTLADPDTLIESAKHNAWVQDIVQDLNTPRPVTAGGTGGATAAAARAALGLAIYEANLGLSSGEQGQARANIGADRGDDAIINGRFVIAQRTLPVVVGPSSSNYTLDRWSVATLAGISCSANRIAAPVGSAYGKYYGQFTFTGTGVTGSNIRQRIEGVETYAGKTVTLFFSIADNVATAGVIQVRQKFGTGGAPSADVAVNYPITIGAALTGQKLVFPLASIVGKTLGSNGDDCVEIVFIPTVANGHVTALAGVTLSLGDRSAEADLPLGRHPQEDRALCQRFLFALPATSWIGYGAVGTLHRIPLFLPTKLRAVPSSIQPTFSNLSNCTSPALGAGMDTLSLQAIVTALGSFRVDSVGGYLEAEL